MTDRTAGFAEVRRRVDVRRLMYQSLIWVEAARSRDDARRFRPTFDTQMVEGLPDALVDGVRGDAEFDGNLFRRQMLIDQRQALQLTRGQPIQAFFAFHRSVDTQSVHGSCKSHLPLLTTV